MKYPKLKSSLLFCFILLLTQCREELNIPEYVQFYNKKDNGLNTIIVQDSNIYTISIRNREYMALINYGPDAIKLSNEELKKQIDETEDYTYVFFKVQNNGKIIKLDSVDKIGQINYFQSAILNDVYLLNSDKKIYPCLSTYISANNIMNEHTLILAFPISFNTIESKPQFVLNKSKYISQNVTTQLAIKNKNSLPKLSF